MASRADTRRKAEALCALHGTGDLVVIPNAFDAASARVLEVAGFPTVATSSAAMAWTAGVADGEELAFETALELHARVARAVAVPASADFEGGYVSGSGSIETTIEALIDAGVVGVGLEDTNFDADGEPLRDPEDHAELIARARATADRLEVPLFINGRTDVFFREVGAPEERAENAIRRLGAYAAAGANGAFAPGISDPGDIARVVERLAVPLNVMYAPSIPSVSELRRLGVGRLTFDAWLYLAALAAVDGVAGEILEDRLDGLRERAALSRDARRAIVH
jgi:2-methylisocitrate lyase-like PEP mutase family enzyme